MSQSAQEGNLVGSLCRTEASAEHTDHDDTQEVQRALIMNALSSSESANIAQRISSEMHGNTFHHHFHLLYDLRTILGADRMVYTEIGTYCGGSASLMMQHPFSTDIHCIDPLDHFNVQEVHFDNNVQKFNIHGHRVRKLKFLSTDAGLKEQLRSENFRTDILFIDGDHKGPAVQHDFAEYEQYVNPGGYIVFDDYFDSRHSPQVRRAVDLIVQSLDRKKYCVVGTFPNVHNAYSRSRIDGLNEFVLYKLP